MQRYHFRPTSLTEIKKCSREMLGGCEAVRILIAANGKVSCSSYLENSLAVSSSREHMYSLCSNFCSFVPGDS